MADILRLGALREKSTGYVNASRLRARSASPQLPSTMCSILKRFVHYHDRWAGHSASSRLEEEQVATIRRKIAALENSSSQVKDFTWLMQVKAELHVCLTCGD